MELVPTLANRVEGQPLVWAGVGGSASGAHPPVKAVRYRRSVARVPVRRAGLRRPDDEFSAWWAADVQDALVAERGDQCEAVRLYRVDAYEMDGWTRLHPSWRGAGRVQPNSFDVLVTYTQEA